MRTRSVVFSKPFGTKDLEGGSETHTSPFADRFGATRTDVHPGHKCLSRKDLGKLPLTRRLRHSTCIYHIIAQGNLLT